MRFYMRRRGLGVSFGFIGLFFVAIGYGLMFGLMLLILLPVILTAIVALVGALVDEILRIVPAYRRRRKRLEPVQWYRSGFDACKPGLTQLGQRLTGRRPRKGSAGLQARHTSTSKAALPALSTEDRLRSLKRQEFMKFVRRLTPVDFCRLAEDMVKKRGYGSVILHSDSDVITMVDADRIKVVVKCVPFASGATVGVQGVRDAVALQAQHQADRLWVFSAQPITPQARRLMSETLTLFDVERLTDFAEKVGWLESNDRQETAVS